MERHSAVLEGTSVNGRYTVEERLAHGETGMLYRAAATSGSGPALLKLIYAAECDSEEQLARWERTSQLSHPNLLPLVDSGLTEIEGEPFVYAAFKYPGDFLAAAAEAGPLGEPEVLDVLVACAAALRYIHHEGLTYPGLAPASVVAVEDRIKLIGDTLREPGQGTSPDADIHALGAMLYQLVTGRPLEPQSAPDLTGIGEPLRTVILHATDPDPSTRWTLDQLVAPLHHNPAAHHSVSQEQEIAAEITRAGAFSEPEVQQDAGAAAAAIVPASLPPEPSPEFSPVKPSKPFPRWIYGIYAAIAVGVFLWVNHNSSAPVSQPAASVARTIPAATPPAATPPTQAPAPAPAAGVTPPATAPTPTAPTSPRNWRVVAFTFAEHTAAEKKARFINGRYPGFHAEVFQPRSRRNLYLVSLGGRMTHEEAQQLQRKARAQGLPPDTYIQNFTE